MGVNHVTETRFARIFRRQTPKAENSNSDEQTCREEEGLGYQTNLHQKRLMTSFLRL